MAPDHEKRCRGNRPRTGADIWLLAQVLGGLVGVRLLLPWVKLRTLLRWIEATPAAGSAAEGTVEKAGRYADALLARLPLARPGPCLVRSLTLYHFALRGGLSVQFHCGARRVNGTLQGHAWLSLNGVPFLEKGDPATGYAVTFSYPASGPEPVKAFRSEHSTPTGSVP